MLPRSGWTWPDSITDHTTVSTVLLPTSADIHVQRKQLQRRLVLLHNKLIKFNCAQTAVQNLPANWLAMKGSQPPHDKVYVLEDHICDNSFIRN